MRYKEPFTIAAGASSVSQGVIVKIVTDYSVVGWGESSPSKRVTGETPETVVKVFGRIAPKLIGMCPLRIEQVVDVVDSVVKGNH